MNSTRQPQPRFTRLVQRLTQGLNARPITERVLIFITATLVIYMLVYVGILLPIEKANSNNRANISLKENEVQLLLQELLITEKNLRLAPKKSRLIHLEELKDELNNTGKFSELMRDLISPREMIRFVDGVLSSNKGITVVRARNMPAVRLWPAPEKTTEDKIEINNQQQSPHKGEFTIYKHGMLLEVKGHYRELVLFLAALEKLPWKILWGDVSLKSNDSDEAVSTLMIYTLSPKKTWLGL